MSEATHHSLRPLRILIVEDSLDAGTALERFLTWKGFSVEQARNGTEALSVAQSTLPDVVLLDIGLPGVDGYYVARQIRKVAGLENVLLVAMTGRGGAEDFRASREAGIDYHLVKPLDFEVLSERLKEWTGGEKTSSSTTVTPDESDGQGANVAL